MLLVLLITLVPSLVGFSAVVVGDEVARVRLSYVLPSDQVATVTPLIAEASAGGVPVAMLVVVALGCGLVMRFLDLDLNAALAAVGVTIVVELMLALSFRGFAGTEELETLVVPMILSAVLVPVVTAAGLRLKDDRPKFGQLGGVRRLASLALLACMVGIPASVDVSWPAWLTALLVVPAWLLFKPAGPANERALRVFLVGGALLIFSVALVAREHLWDGRVLVAAIALGLVTLWLARAEGAWLPRALVVGFVAVGVGGLAAVAAAHEDPTPVEAVVALTDDGALTCGIHIATIGGRQAYVEIGGGRREVKLVADDKLLAYKHEEASLGAWRSVARQLAVQVMQDRRIRRATTPSEFCQPDRPPAPKRSEGLTIAQRYQPDLKLPLDDGFWPVSVITAFGLRDRAQGTCIDARGPTPGCGLNDGLPWSGGADRWLEYPSNERDTSRQERAMTAVLGSKDPHRSALQYFLVSRGETDTWNVQYWSFYVFNYQDDTPGGYHEGDFELAGLVLSASRRPRYVWMSRHEAYEGRPFAFDEAVFQGENHIDLQIARGSHAAYDTCGRQHRPGVPPDDHPACGELSYRLRPQLSDLALAPWACWQGRFGHQSRGGSTGRTFFGAGPFSPLWQQEFDGTRAEPCKAVPEDPGGAPFKDEANPEPAARELRDAAGRLEWLFDECSDWEKRPAAGSYLVACDQAALRDYFASGLDDESAARIRITGVGRDPEPTVPAVWRTRRSTSLERPVITASADSRLRVYAVCDDMSGGRVAATFESVRVSGGSSATIDDRDPALWQLRGTDGRVLAKAAPSRLSYESSGRPRPGPAVSARCRR